MTSDRHPDRKPGGGRLTRRDFTRVLAAGVAGAAGLVVPERLSALTRHLPTRSARPDGHPLQETFFEWRTVAPGVHVAIGQGGNAMLVREGGQALLSDSKNFGFGYTLRREAEAMGTPLTRVVNTHHHGDHVGGNPVFGGDLPLVGHPVAAERIRGWADEVAGRESERLTRTAAQLRETDAPTAVVEEVERLASDVLDFDAQRFVPSVPIAEADALAVGARTVQIRHVGAGHTDNDVFLFVPSENVLHTGDLLFNGRHGFMDQNGGVSSEGWQRSVQAMLDVADGETVVVPGHGDITDRSGLQRQWDYFEQLRDAVVAAVAEGMSRDEVTALRPASVADVSGSPARNLGVVYDEVTGG